MPLYVADYLADTGHLSAAEHGAYLMLIMHYWANGGLPDDDKKLARIARMTPDEWADARETIEDFFHDGWAHSRIDKELSDASAAYERRAAAGRKAHSRNDKTAMHEQCMSNADALPQQSQPQSQSPNNQTIPDNLLDGRLASPSAPRKASRAKPRSQIADDAQPSEADREAASHLPQDQFRVEWRKFRDHHRAKGSLMADWSAAWRTWVGNIAQFQPARAGPKNKQSRDPWLAALSEINDDREIGGFCFETDGEYAPEPGCSIIDYRGDYRRS